MIPLLIRTSGRTGSTLLQNILKSSPEILVRGGYPYEERHISYLYRLSELPFSGQAPKPGTEWSYESVINSCKLIGRYPGAFPIVSDSEFGKSKILQALWSGYLDANEKLDGKQFRYYSEKVSDDVGLINKYLYCKNIFLVRDPRDQLISIREFDRKRGFKGFGAISESNTDAIRTLCRALKVMYKVASEIEVNEDRRILVRYEDLVERRSECLFRLSQWLSVSFDLDVFEQENILYRDVHSTSRNFQDSIERWKNLLSDVEISIFNEELGSCMNKLGYI